MGHQNGLKHSHSPSIAVTHPISLAHAVPLSQLLPSQPKLQHAEDNSSPREKVPPVLPQLSFPARVHSVWWTRNRTGSSIALLQPFLPLLPIPVPPPPPMLPFWQFHKKLKIFYFSRHSRSCKHIRDAIPWSQTGKWLDLWLTETTK